MLEYLSNKVAGLVRFSENLSRFVLPVLRFALLPYYRRNQGRRKVFHVGGAELKYHPPWLTDDDKF